jgi:hypothetical protein
MNGRMNDIAVLPHAVCVVLLQIFFYDQNKIVMASPLVLPCPKSITPRNYYTEEITTHLYISLI